MIAEFALPDLGEGLPDAELVQWLVAEGEEVALNQPIAEVETAKAVIELPSPYAGTVHRLHAAAGEIVEVGHPLIGIDVAGADGPGDAAGGEGVAGDEVAHDGDARDEDAGAALSKASGEVTTASASASASAEHPAAELDAAEASVPNLVGYGAVPRGADRPRRRPRTDRRVDGPHGSVPDEERREAASAPDVSAAPAGRSRTVIRTPVRGVRRAMADTMVRSAFTAPHVTCFLDVDVTATTTLVADLRADPRWGERRIGILAVVARAVCLALAAEPALNSHWDAVSDEIVEHHYVDLGIAAATPRGLLVPHIPDADALALPELADALHALTDQARSGRATPAALTGGTFSISNVGALGLDAGTPLLDPPQSGILGLGAVRRRPWEYADAVVLRDVLTLSLSFDHRVVDGAQGARFLRVVGDVLRDPGRAMLFA